MNDSREGTNTDLLNDWTKSEKFTLLQCIKVMGSRDIERIRSEIPTKTEEQIKTAVEYYKTKALPRKQPCTKPTTRTRVDPHMQPTIPLSKWAKFLIDSIRYEDLQTEVATALRIIADFENMPNAVSKDLIDIRKAYHILANAVEGKALEDNKDITALINKSILETALTGKFFFNCSTVKQIVENIELKSDKDVNGVYKPTINKELSIIQHLWEQRNYNPLNISKDHLKASTK